MESTARPLRPTGLKEARALVQDLFPPRPGIYWPDMLASAAVGWAAFILAVFGPGPWLRALGFAVAVLALYRAVLFVHELSHLSRGKLPGFSLAWNLLVGVPMMVPSFTYVGVHTEHHRRTVYGTAADPEYLPLARGSRLGILLFLAETVLAPALFALRFVLLSPLGWLIGPFGRLLERRASSLAINFAFTRRDLRPDERRRMRAAEAGIVLLWWTLLALMALEVLPWRLLLVWYLVSVGVALINQVRTLAAHHYRSDGSQLDVIGQLTDSVNIVGGPWWAILAPVGLRFHALHHYLPDMPYHGLVEAHRRLLDGLPAEIPYPEVNHRGLGPVLRTLWREAGRSTSSPGGETPR
jgi:fatty acid desaturase